MFKVWREEKIAYEIRPNAGNTGRNKSINWRLFVTDASSALECLRCDWGSYLEDIALGLYKSGIPFTTLRKSTFRPSPSLPPFFGLGYRPLGFSFDMSDYLTYVEARTSFLQLPHARAAVLRGGITWRLSMNNCDEYALIMGPTEAAEDYGALWEHGAADFVDDSLSAPNLTSFAAFTRCGHSEIKPPTSLGGQKRLFGMPAPKCWLLVSCVRAVVPETDERHSQWDSNT